MGSGQAEWLDVPAGPIGYPDNRSKAGGNARNRKLGPRIVSMNY
jgi:hypothetical protein